MLKGSTLLEISEGCFLSAYIYTLGGWKMEYQLYIKRSNSTGSTIYHVGRVVLKEVLSAGMILNLSELELYRFSKEVPELRGLRTEIQIHKFYEFEGVVCVVASA
jgi:hypothetical protein